MAELKGKLEEWLVAEQAKSEQAVASLDEPNSARAN
jgi:hypothetical protein